MILTYILIFTTFFVSIFFITQPLFSQDTNYKDNKTIKKTDRDSIFLTLNELEFDYQSGKLSKNDFEKLTNEYKMKATSLLKQEENLLSANTDTINGPDMEIREKIESETEREILDLIEKVQSEHK